MFCKKAVFKNFAIFTGKHLPWSLKACNFIKKRLQRRCFLRTPILKKSANGWFCRKITRGQYMSLSGCNFVLAKRDASNTKEGSHLAGMKLFTSQNIIYEEFLVLPGSWQNGVEFHPGQLGSCNHYLRSNVVNNQGFWHELISHQNQIETAVHVFSEIVFLKISEISLTEIC